MSLEKNKDNLSTGIKIRFIELLNHTLVLPETLDANTITYTFDISAELKADKENKLVFVIVTIEIFNEGKVNKYGSICVSSIFEIENFDTVVEITPEGKINLPEQLLVILNSVSISTTRGVMFGVFKGTFLHNAILPIVDPKIIKSLNNDAIKKSEQEI